MRKNDKRVHHMLDLIGGMQPYERELVVRYARLKGLPVPRVIGQACREFVVTHANELREAQQRELVLEDLANIP